MSITGGWHRALTDYSNPDSFGSKLRARRFSRLLRMIETVYAERGMVRIIDIGGTAHYWTIVPREYLERHQVTITIANLPGAALPANDGPFEFVEADACDLSRYADQSFDIGHSNSVVEHVGSWSNMLLYAREAARVSRRLFVQTPNFWFPIEPHFMTPFFAWLPEPVRVWLVLHFGLGAFAKAANVDEAVQAVQSVRLLDKRMFRELFKDAEIVTERFLLLPKSFVAIKD